MRSDAGLHTAALASADMMSAAVASVGVTAGLMESLDTYRDIEDIRRRWGFAPEKLPSLTAVLDLMVDQGLLRRRDDPPAYRRTCAFAHETGSDILAALRRRANSNSRAGGWLGAAHADAVWHAHRSFLGDRLDHLATPHGKLTFDSAYEDTWHANLTNPLYEFGRQFCVRALARRSGRYLDLASGLGYGTQRLVEWSDGHATVVALDKSVDFMAVAGRLLFPPTAYVTHRVWDLNEGLPELPPGMTFDGVLFMGAFHYIDDKLGLLRQIHRVLEPRGRLAIGQCYVRCGLTDDTVNRYMFSLAAERSHIVSKQELLTLLAEAGFAFVADQPRGSQYSVVAEKDPNGPNVTDRA